MSSEFTVKVKVEHFDLFLRLLDLLSGLKNPQIQDLRNDSLGWSNIVIAGERKKKP